ncbi:MAG: glycosyltransferase family 2 protein [Marinosulfonomonas sp.]|nr:glycosyltransferase family 2 protein [Marinosulfonomonas sp.]
MKDFGNINSVSVSIVMPCLNEAATIGPCIKMAKEAIQILKTEYNLTGEIIVADNGSEDGSQKIASDAGAMVVSVSERGYGAALKAGFSAANGQYLIMGDSDCSYNFVEAVPMIKKLMDGADLCMGSRFQGEIKPGAMPWKNRYIGNPALSTMLRLLFKTKISDSHCGIRAITADGLEKLRLTSDGMEFASEMVLKSALLKLEIAEVPVTLSPDERGRPPHLNPVRDGLRHLFYMLMLSPMWLFVAPSAILAGFGLFIFTVLVANPDSEMVRIGNFGIGDHWAVVASSALIIATQTTILGLAAMVLSYRDGYRIMTPTARKLLSFSTLGKWLAVGAIGIGAGLTWATIIATGWVGSDFGTLNQIRGLIAAFSLIVIGIQACFGGFLLSVSAGNRLRHSNLT